MADKQKGIDRDSNVFKPEDFEKLEKNEQGLMSKIFKKKKGEENTEVVKKDETIDIMPMDDKQMLMTIAKLQKKIDNVIMTQEKQSAKVEMQTQKATEVNDRMAMLSEQIGELRSTVMARERLIDRMDSNLSLMKETINDIRPDHYRKLIDMKEREIIANRSKIELMETNLSKTTKELSGYKKIMSKIKNFEHLIVMLDNVDKHIKDIEKKNIDVERMAGKVEAMFFELNRSLKLINQHDAKISSNTEAVKDALKTLDKLSVKSDSYAKKSDLDKIKKQIEELKGNMVSHDVSSFEALQLPASDVSVTKSVDTIYLGDPRIEPLKKYIKDSLDKGMKKGELKKSLLKVGWPESLIESLL